MEHTVVENGDVFLETLIETPSTNDKNAIVIVTHPHSKLGGNYANNVVRAVAKHLCRDGYHVLSFNFRGVGDSSGESTWGGQNERSDVESVVAFARNRFPECKKVFLVGYSFGSAVGLATNCNIDAYVAISYPNGFITSFVMGSLFRNINQKAPKLFIIGAQDQFAGKKRVKSFVDHLECETEFLLLEDRDHFWVDTEKELLQPISVFLEKQLSR